MVLIYNCMFNLIPSNYFWVPFSLVPLDPYSYSFSLYPKVQYYTPILIRLGISVFPIQIF